MTTTATTVSNTAEDWDKTWNKIEAMYFSSMNELRKKEDVTLEADFVKRRDPLKMHISDAFECLRALCNEYAALERDFESVQQSRKKERGQVDAERRLWFRTYRRGGLAYQIPKEGEDGSGKLDVAAAAATANADAAREQRQEQEEGAEVAENWVVVANGTKKDAVRGEQPAEQENPPAQQIANGHDEGECQAVELLGYTTSEQSVKRHAAEHRRKGPIAAAELPGQAGEVLENNSAHPGTNREARTQSPREAQASGGGFTPVNRTLSRHLADTQDESEGMGRPPAHSDDAVKSALRPLKRKALHTAPRSTPSESEASPGPATETTAGLEAPWCKLSSQKQTGSEPPPQKPRIVLLRPAPGDKPKKIKIITRQTETGSEPPPQHKKPRMLLRPAPQDDELEASLADGGYTSTDSFTGYPLVETEWRLRQVKTPNFATNQGVTQYWHLVNPKKPGLIEHQVLGSVTPVKWSILKEPYNFHLEISVVREVVFAQRNTRIAIMLKDRDKRGDIMARFLRDHTKRRFLEFLKCERVKVVEMDSGWINTRWDSMTPAVLEAS